MSAIPRAGGDVMGVEGVALSRKLLGPLELVAGRARVLGVFRALFQWIVVTAAGWLVLILLLGSFEVMPVWVVMVLAFLGWVMAVGGAVWFFKRAFWKGDASSAARLVDAALPGAQERFSSALELSQCEEDARFRGSAELIATLVRQAEHAAKELDPTEIVSGKNVFRWFLMLAPVALVWFVLLVVMTPTIGRGMGRMFMPWVVPMVLPKAKLEVEPQNETIAQGDQVTVSLTVTPLGVSGAGTGDVKIEHATITRRSTAGGTDQDVTTEMDRTGNETFRAIFDNVQQGFSYKVSSEGVDSPTYVVTVQARPAAASIQFEYRYPAYTGREVRTVSSRDGAMDGLVGTQVVMTVEATVPVNAVRIAVTDNAPNPGLIDLRPVGNSTTRFSTAFTIRKTTEYHLQMTDMQGLENSDTQARAITARLDGAPQISIVSPTDGMLKVTGEDVVGVKYGAVDDFGLARVEGLIQADDRAGTVVVLPVKAPAEASASGVWSLSVAEIVKRAGAGGVKRISYQLRATDNREPEGQVGLSAKQVLVIDETATPLAERVDSQAAKTLSDAIRRAEAELADAKDKLDILRKNAAGRAWTGEEKQQAADARRDLTNAAQTLDSAADKAGDSRLAEAAKEAKAIADQPIREAEENTAASQLAADQADSRNKSLDGASQNIAEAQRRLEQLGKEVGEQAKDQPVAHELERIAAEQERLADGLARSPNDPKLLEQQKELQKDLEKVIKDHPELQKPAAEAAEGKKEEVQKRIQELKQTQEPLNAQAKSQEEAANVQDKLNDLAKKQEELNQKIGQFSQQQGEALKQTGTKPPESSQLDPIVKNLQMRKLTDAGQAQNASAAKLEQTSRELEGAQKRQEEAAGANARAAQQAAEAEKEAGALQEQANQLREKISEAEKNHNPAVRPSDPANQEAGKLADQMKREAQQIAQNPAGKEAAKGASDEADAAKKEAAQGHAASAQQHLANGAQRLADAAQAAKSQAASGSGLGTAQAAAQARDLAEQQRVLADQTQQAGRSMENAAAARNHADESAKQQQALAQKMDQTAQSARELQKQTQGSAPEVSDRAGKTADSLQKAAQAQRAAAQATESGNSSQAAGQQKQSEGELAAAEQTMSGQGKPSEQSSQAGGQRGGQANGQGKSSGQSPASSGQASGGGKEGGAGSQAAEAVQAARNAQSQAAGGNPMAAREAANQLSQASKQLTEGGSGQGAKPAGAMASSGGQSGGKPGSPGPGASGQGSGSGREKIPGSGNGSGAAMSTDQTGGNGNAEGIRVASAQGGGSRPLPKSVEEIGVSPSDWARLPARAQEQLLNSAQQSGPPAYREMIKNYYSRIAHLDEPGGAP